MRLAVFSNTSTGIYQDGNPVSNNDQIIFYEETIVESIISAFFRKNGFSPEIRQQNWYRLVYLFTEEMIEQFEKILESYLENCIGNGLVLGACDSCKFMQIDSWAIREEIFFEFDYVPRFEVDLEPDAIEKILEIIRRNKNTMRNDFSFVIFYNL